MPPTLTADPTTVNVNAQIPPQPGLESDPQTAQIPQPEASASPGTQPTSAAGAPAGAANPDAYNPLAAQPYTPPEAVPVTPLPQSQLGPDQPPNGAVSHAGGVAYGLDQVLRGFMRGRAQNQAAQAINLAKTSSGLQKNLDMASQQYYALARAGTDPNSEQMQDAKSQVDAAWQANMEFMKQHIAGQQIDKKTGQIKPQEGGISGLMQRLVNGQDPAAQALAVYQGAQKLGPPVYHQAAPFQTPAYQAYARTQAQTVGATAQGQLSAAQLAATKNQQEADYNTLLTKTNRTPEEDDKLNALGQALDKPGSLTQRVQDQMAEQIQAQVKLGQISSAEGVRQLAILKSHSAAGLFLKQPQLGSKGFLQAQYAKLNGIDPTQLTPQDLTYLDRAEAFARNIPVSTSRQQLVPGVDSQGRVGMIPMTTFSTRGVAGAPQPPPGRKFIDDVGAVPTEEAGDAASNPVVPPKATPSAMTAAAGAHSNALAGGATPTQALKVARVAAIRTQKATSSDEPPGFIPTGKPRQQTPDETDAYKTEGNIGKQLTTAEQAAKLSNHAVGDTMLSTSLAHANVGGRLSNFDIQRFSNLGSARLRMEGDVLRTIDGTMTDEQRNMILDYLRVSYQSAHDLAEHYRNRDAGVGQISSKTSSPASGSSNSAPSVDDLENLFQKAKAK